MSLQNPRVGEAVVYTKSKQSAAPGPRAKQVNPARQGDSYSYVVDKYWRIKQVHGDATVTLVTRRGKMHVLPIEDPCLRKANLWERLLQSHRFPSRSSFTNDSEASLEYSHGKIFPFNAIMRIDHPT